MNKPERKHVTFYRYQGRYNFCSTEEQAQYIFRLPEDAPENLKRGFLIDLEKDEDYNDGDMTALELAEWIKDVYESYWIHSGVGEIKALFEYLESIEGDQERLRAEYELEHAKYQAAYWAAKVEELTGREG
ncbi:hypothetical protein D3C77_441520 [compost metagenome]